MRIIILSDFFPPLHTGGADIIAYRSAKSLQEAGNDIVVISTCRELKDAGWRKIDGLRVLFLHNNCDLRLSHRFSLRNRKILTVLEKHLKILNPDVIHAHIIHVCFSYAVLKLCKEICSKVFLTAHDVNIFHQEKFFTYIDKKNLSIPESFNYKLTLKERIKQLKNTLNPFRNLIIKHYLRYVNKIFAVSQALKDALQQNGITNIEIVYNGVEIEDNIINNRKLIRKKFNINEDVKIIFMANRFSGLKGGNLILDYIEEIKKSFDNFIVVVASKKSRYIDNILRQAEKKNISRHLFFTGWLDKEDLDLVYSGCDICLVPSICFDSFPNNNLEAMAFRKPVVGTCFGGTPEAVIDNETGYIVNPFDIQKTALKIIDLLSNKDKAKKFGEAGYQRVKNNFSLDRQLKKTLRHYEDTVN